MLLVTGGIDYKVTIVIALNLRDHMLKLIYESDVRIFKYKQRAQKVINKSAKNSKFHFFSIC